MLFQRFRRSIRVKVAHTSPPKNGPGSLLPGPVLYLSGGECYSLWHPPSCSHLFTMAVKKTAARPRSSKAPSTRSTPRDPSAWRWVLPVLRRLVRFARPRTASEGVALALVLLALFAVGTQAYSSVRRGYLPGADITWPG